MLVDRALAVRVNHGSRVFWRGEKGVVHELSCRRSRFQSGNPICLANDQEWTFPAPGLIRRLPRVRGSRVPGTDPCRAGGRGPERTAAGGIGPGNFPDRAELRAQLDDLANLFTFQPRSQELTNSQHAFESLARDHILSLARRGKLPLPAPSPSADRRPRGRRVLAWLRSRGLMRKWLPSS